MSTIKQQNRKPLRHAKPAAIISETRAGTKDLVRRFLGKIIGGLLSFTYVIALYAVCQPPPPANTLSRYLRLAA